MIIGNKLTNPGEMRTRISLQSPTMTEDVGGFDAPGYATQATVWSKWVNVHGNEVWVAQAVQASEPATVLMRYYATLDETWTILKGTQRYRIVSVDNIGERGEYMELKVERMAGG